MNKSVWQAGHRPTLIAVFLYFDLAFMGWVLLGPLAPAISQELGLNPAQRGLIGEATTLAGAIQRLVHGLLVDLICPKTKGAVGPIIVHIGIQSCRDSVCERW